jgi:hypothetical protein
MAPESSSLTKLSYTCMHLKRWLAGLFSKRGKALSFYRSGMLKARKHDYHGAIDDYTAALSSPHAPMDVRGMATYNRALAYAALNEDEKAAEDLASMLKMPGLPQNIITEARQRRERIRRRLSGGDAH